LALLESGLSVQTALDSLLGPDENRESRQLAIIDAKGRTAAHTGSLCMNWAGDR